MANLSNWFGPNERFYPLDNSAVFIASVTGKSSPFLYRVSCELDHPVYLPDLEKALAQVIERFPFFKAELRPGFFWYYLDPLKRPVHLTADTRFPVEYHSIRKWGHYLFRIRVFSSRIACEFHHILTDGTGAMEFLKSLTSAYLTLRGVVSKDWEGIIKPGSPIISSEFEDAYAGKLKKHIPEPAKLLPAFLLPGKRYPGIAYRITTGTASVSAALKTAKAKGVSLTELLAAVHLFALQEIAESGPSAAKKPICIQVPVNLRRLYPSATLRNFFLFVPVTLDRRLGHYELDEIIHHVHHTMKLNLNTKEMDRQIKRNVGGEENPFSKPFPLFVKNIVLRIICKIVSDKPFSGSISNIGAVSMPDAFAKHIQRFDLIPARNTLTGANVGIISWKDKLSINIGSLIIDRSFEKSFFTNCVKLGIPLIVESNL